MILVLTDAADEVTRAVLDGLAQRGAPCLVLSRDAFPGHVTINLDIGPPEHETTLRVHSTEVTASAITAIWAQAPVAITADPRIADPKVRSFVTREIGDVLLEVFDVLPGAWLPGHPDVVRKAQRKWWQLRTAADLGFTIPATLVSNDPERLLAFYRRHDGGIASKLAGATGFHAHLGTELNRYTEVVPPRDLVEYRSLALCPVAFQRYIPKQYELRITVVGDRVFCARIDSQRSNQSRHDWRQYDMASAALSRWQVPDDISGRCVALVELLGLTYGAIDMIVTPDGEHVFLELNPSGQFWWLEQQLGLPISDAICDRLAGMT